MEITAVGLWLVAIIGETVADRQLAAFRANPDNRGRTCRSGLWAYSRHPNYFFEWLNWCAYALMALPAPYGWAGLASPVIMLFLILKVTGVPPSEEQALASRGDDYRDYQRTTSVFIPWFPKRSTT
jgi:steroid 5-alpha reductase family enzyme